MGLTDVAKPVEEFVKKTPKYEDFARHIISLDKTAIFEWCSRSQRIVIDYPVDRLVLTAIRNNVTGEYDSIKDMYSLASYWDIDVVNTYNGNSQSIMDFFSEVCAAEDIEGYIIRFDDGHMVKVKGEWYLRIHKTKDNLNYEKNIIDMIVKENIDDAKAFMLKEDRKRVEEFEKKFWKGVYRTVDIYNIYFNEELAEIDRKEYAIKYMKKDTQINPQIIFAMYDKKTC